MPSTVECICDNISTRELEKIKFNIEQVYLNSTIFSHIMDDGFPSQ
jgi:hypothetical protein